VLRQGELLYIPRGLVHEAATTDGKVRPTSRSAEFIALVKGRRIYPALSGRTMEFDGSGKCVSGCS